MTDIRFVTGGDRVPGGRSDIDMIRFHRIKGTYLHHGVRDDAAPNQMHVLVEDGRAWPMRDAQDTNPIGKAYGDQALTVSEDGDLLISGSVAFCPEPEELVRIGIA